MKISIFSFMCFASIHVCASALEFQREVISDREIEESATYNINNFEAYGNVEVISPSAEDPSLRWPEFRNSWGLKEAIYRMAQLRYQELMPKLKNYRYVVVVDFSRHSSKRRFFLFDLLLGSMESHLTAHGSGSDPNQNGIPTKFSNEPRTYMSSLGAYVTMSTYEGGHGHSLLLSGQDPTNDNAESRAIVLHPASYVSDEGGYARNSWGCPAMDPSISTSVIEKIKDGALLYIGTI